MADIDLQKKEQGLGWLWALLALLLLVLLAWWLWPDGDDDLDSTMDEMSVVDPYDEPERPVAQGLAAIVANPSAWIGQTFPDMRVEVGDEMTDRGFFIENGGAEMMAVIIDWPSDSDMDINPDQTLRITDGTLRGPEYIGSITGVPLDPDTESLLREQQIYLVVDEANIEIVGNMASVDTDGNGEISEDEYRAYMVNTGVFDRWDTDRNGFMDQSEYNALGFANDPGYSTLDGDGDGYLDSGEFHDAVWTMHDRDENGLWDGDEWDDVGDSDLFGV